MPPDNTTKHLTYWVPLNGKGYQVPTGTAFLVDQSGNFLVDQSKNFLVTNGFDLYPLNATAWTEAVGS